jgi:hypothetical protein
MIKRKLQLKVRVNRGEQVVLRLTKSLNHILGQCAAFGLCLSYSHLAGTLTSAEELARLNSSN